MNGWNLTRWCGCLSAMLVLAGCAAFTQTIQQVGEHVSQDQDHKARLRFGVAESAPPGTAALRIVEQFFLERADPEQQANRFETYNMWGYLKIITTFDSNREVSRRQREQAVQEALGIMTDIGKRHQRDIADVLSSALLRRLGPGQLRKLEQALGDDRVLAYHQCARNFRDEAEHARCAVKTGVNDALRQQAIHRRFTAFLSNGEVLDPVLAAETLAFVCTHLDTFAREIQARFPHATLDRNNYTVLIGLERRRCAQAQSF